MYQMLSWPLHVIHNSMQIVHGSKLKYVEENRTSKRIYKQNAILQTTMENMESYANTANQI